MKYIEVNLAEELDEVKIIPLFDLHLGSELCDVKTIKDYLKKDAFFVLGGDLIDNGIKDSITNVYHQELTPQEQLDLLVDLFKPYAQRIIGIISGNHELRTDRTVGIDLLRVFSQLIDRENYYDPNSLVLSLRFGKNRHGKKLNYTMYVLHGWSSARTSGGKINALQELRKVIITDIYLMGHGHLKGMVCEDIFLPDPFNKKIMRLKQYFISAGSFVEYGDYAERKGRTIPQLGAPIITLSGKEKNVSISI